MAKKQHVLLNNRPDPPIEFRYKGRKIIPTPKDEDKDYTLMAQRLQNSVRQFAIDRDARVAARTLNVPVNIQYIEIRFQDQFDVNKYTRSYLTNFGLDAVKFYEYNRRVLFAIVDNGRFNSFMEKLSLFIRYAQGDAEVSKDTLDKRILFLHDFNLLSSARIKQFERVEPIVRFSLLESLHTFREVNRIEDEIERFLRGSNVLFVFDRTNHRLETIGASQDVVEDLIDNFDIIFSATSSLSSVIRPGAYQTPVREYGFTIANAGENLPLIGIIDTGIDAATPLSRIIADAIDKTNTDPRIDNENHGTAVAALAAMGKRPYLANYRGAFQSDAKLLSLKVMNTSPAALSDSVVLDIIREAKAAHPAIKLFTLTINYVVPRKNNQLISDYACALDKLAHELDILIFISTSNNNLAVGNLTAYDVNHFNNELTNLCSPSESLNNICTGGCADNLLTGAFMGIAPLKEFPALYSRRNCQDQTEYFSERKINRHLRKPDILQPGGDYEVHNNFMGTGEQATLELLSANPAEGFYKNVGTSFSAPLAANLAAQLLKLYPDLRAQSIKALVVNACDESLIKLETDEAPLKRTIGYGIPQDEAVVYSNPNSVTFVVENEIKHSQLIAIPIALPEYLQRVAKDRGLLKVTATLCFSFDPEPDNQLAYCPIFIAYSIFRNKTLAEIKDDYSNALLRERWSQDGYAKASPILYSNVQKISFSISKSDIIDESGIIKLALHCMLNRQIKATVEETKRRIQESHRFSMAITIEEKQAKANVTNRLYSNIILTNDIVNIGTAALDADLDV